MQKGVLRLRWADRHMAVLGSVREELKDSGALEGVRVGMALHVEAKTGMLAVTLAEAGAKVRLASCNPLSTDDSVALALREEYGLEVFARRSETQDEYYDHLDSVIDLGPDFVIDDGADLISELHTRRTDMMGNVKGGNEETTTGIIRLRAMADEGALRFPVVSVNDALMKHLFDNRYGTGQSTFDGFMNATNLLVAGKTLVVAGYGWCGRGVAMRAKGLGANVVVTEVDPVKGIEAIMDGFRVMPMIDAVTEADIIITVTGCKDVLRPEHMLRLKDGCVLGNTGHFDNEISTRYLEDLAGEPVRVRDHVDQYTFADGRRTYLISEGRLMNLGAGQGHPVEIMDMSFAIQALSLRYLVENHEHMASKVHPVPPELDQKVAELKLATMGVSIDRLTSEQRNYLSGWREGT